MSANIAFRFVGRTDEFLTGVPAHDLTDDDVAALTPEQWAILEAHLKTDRPIYKEIPKKTAPATGKVEGKASG